MKQFTIEIEQPEKLGLEGSLNKITLTSKNCLTFKQELFNMLQQSLGREPEKRFSSWELYGTGHTRFELRNKYHKGYCTCWVSWGDEI